MSRWIVKLFVVALLMISTLSAQLKEDLLNTSEIKEVMDQLLKKHVVQNRLTPEVVRNSFKIYIDQFDPERIYLLDSEVQSFINPSKEELSRFLNELQKENYDSYKRIETLIVKAIARSRQWREELEKKDSSLFEEKDVKGAYRKWGEKNYLLFAKTENELKGRLRQDIQRYIAQAKEEYGSAKVMKKRERVVALYESDMREHEDSYYPYDDEGKLYSANIAEHHFVLHVLKALAKSLDAHTSFFDSSEAYDMKVRLEKGYEGTGLVFFEGLDGPTVASISKGSPAEVNGEVSTDDVLIAIDGVNVTNLPFDQVMDKLRGSAGTYVKMSFRHGEGTQKDRIYTVELKRERLMVEEDRASLSYDKFGNGVIGVITLNSFYQNPNGISSETDIRDAIEKLRRQGPILGLILDFRENSGGYLSQAVKVAGLFITNGVVVISKYNDGEMRYYRDLDSRVYYKGPLVILTSKGTASAAEIVAQALQDYGVALVVGDEKTFGKGTIQSQTVTDGNSPSSLFKVTVGEYFTASGNTPQVKGVRADIVVPTNFYQMRIGEEYLSNTVKNETINPAFNDRLDDLGQEVKPWFMRYYIPTLQKRTDMWRGMIPKLRVNSQYRIAHNKEYQDFFSDEKAGSTSAFPPGKRNKMLDVQLLEAKSIVKDMFLMRAQLDEERQVKVEKDE